MRKIEILHIQKQDIKFRERKLVVKSAKNHKIRIIDIDLKLTIILFFYCKNLKYDDYLFHLKSSYVSVSFYNRMRNSNLKKILFHVLRHIYASYLLSNIRNPANAILVVQNQLRSL